MKLLKRFQRLSRIGLPNIEPQADRHGIAIAVIIKNEADYLPEWITFHKLVGVRGFYIYDNGSTDESVAIARHFIGDDGLVIPFAGHFVDQRLSRPIDTQTLAFAHAIANFGSQYRWMSFIDPDEFLLPKSEATIPEVLEKHMPDAVNISLPWHMFGPNGHEQKPDGLTIENYTARYGEALWPETAYPFKLIVDPCEVSMISTHQAETRRDGAQSQNDQGLKVDNKSRRNAEFYSSKNLQLNHYFTRSMEELRARKLSRGRVSRQGDDYLDNALLSAIDLIQSNSVDDQQAQAYAAQLKALLNSAD